MQTSNVKRIHVRETHSVRAARIAHRILPAKPRNQVNVITRATIQQVIARPAVQRIVAGFSRNSVRVICPDETRPASFIASSGESCAASRKSRTAPEPRMLGKLAISSESSMLSVNSE